EKKESGRTHAGAAATSGTVVNAPFGVNASTAAQSGRIRPLFNRALEKPPFPLHCPPDDTMTPSRWLLFLIATLLFAACLQGERNTNPVRSCSCWGLRCL